MKVRAVHFIYLGQSLPRYANASLDLAARFSGLEVHLLANATVASAVRSKLVKFTAIEEFYNPEEFERASKQLQNDGFFRNGFWLKTLERFFVLEQYFKITDSQGLFHAELDQLLFRTDVLLSRLEATGHRGVFFPLHSKTFGVASVFFCNNHEAIRSLIDFSLVNEYENEMSLLANWASESPELVFALPTLGSSVNADPTPIIEKVHELSHLQIGGVVDASQVGQWVGGIDPKNVPINEIPKTKFVNTSGERCLSVEQLHKLKFYLNRNDGFLSVTVGGNLSYNVYNLHLHSKSHNFLNRSNSSMDKFFKWSNSKEARPVPGSRKVQLSGHLRSRAQFFLEDPRRIVVGLRRRISGLFNFNSSR